MTESHEEVVDAFRKEFGKEVVAPVADKVCPTCGQEPHLSDQQRNEYFRMIDALLQYPKIKPVGKKALDLYFRYQFLTVEEVTLPNKEVRQITPSLSRVKGPNVSNMSEFIDRCRERVDEWGIAV